MAYQKLRQKYPKFIYEKYEYKFKGNNLEIKYFFSISEHKFVHHIQIQDSRFKIHESIENLIFNLGLSLIPSYWKTTCSPTIQLSTVHSQLSTKQLEFWHKLFLNGMGEYFYKNQIDFTAEDFLTIKSSKTSPYPSPESGEGTKGEVKKSSVLIPLGGGKDSIVTLELLKPHYQVTPFIINPVPVMRQVCKIAGLQPATVTSTLDPHLLEMNTQGYLNGHVPVSAFYAFCAILTAHLLNIPYIAFSNERSSDEGNAEYLGHTINHQYSKTLEFEIDLSAYIKNLKLKIKNFSFLRPLYELQITKLFCNYPQYFKVFSSCNKNFQLSTLHSPLSTHWCQKCPKCVSTAMMLARFIDKDKVTEIMGAYPPDLPINQSLINQLTGNSPTKPFECVLTRAEARAALTGIGQDKILSSWQDNPNMPKEFEKILKSHL